MCAVGAKICQAQNSQTTCAELFRRRKNGDAFLERIITGDETRVHHCDPLPKIQSMEWHHELLQLKKNSKCRILWLKSRLKSSGTVKEPC